VITALLVLGEERSYVRDAFLQLGTIDAARMLDGRGGETLQVGLLRLPAVPFE
jgi:hypothetical protein